MSDYIPDDWPENEGELPPSLEYLLGRFADAIRGFTESLKKNPSTLMTWYNSFRQSIIAYIQAAFMAGQRSDYMGVTERGYVYDYIKAQVDYLNNFRLVIQSADEWNNQWDARAESYARGIVAPYWKGRTKYLPLPAMPGDGSTDCGQLCACLWDIKVIDEQAGDYDCYWLMNASRIVKTEHCQDCLTRSIIWTPLKIRGNELVLDPTQVPEGYIAPDLLKYQEYIETALKHYV